MCCIGLTSFCDFFVCALLKSYAPLSIVLILPRALCPILTLPPPLMLQHTYDFVLWQTVLLRRNWIERHNHFNERTNKRKERQKRCAALCATPNMYTQAQKQFARIWQVFVVWRLRGGGSKKPEIYVHTIQYTHNTIKFLSSNLSLQYSSKKLHRF